MADGFIIHRKKKNNNIIIENGLVYDDFKDSFQFTDSAGRTSYDSSSFPEKHFSQDEGTEDNKGYYVFFSGFNQSLELFYQFPLDLDVKEKQKMKIIIDIDINYEMYQQWYENGTGTYHAQTLSISLVDSSNNDLTTINFNKNDREQQIDSYDRFIKEIIIDPEKNYDKIKIYMTSGYWDVGGHTQGGQSMSIKFQELSFE